MATTTERGYGADHQRKRKAWRVRIDEGGVLCYRCERPIPPGGDFHLDHKDDRSGYAGVSHPRCNLAAGGRINRKGLTRELTYDELNCGYANAPIGTISNNGKRIKTAGGAWGARWAHEAVNSGNPPGSVDSTTF